MVGVVLAGLHLALQIELSFTPLYAEPTRGAYSCYYFTSQCTWGVPSLRTPVEYRLSLIQHNTTDDNIRSVRS